ncbi:MAG TPA: carboxymuconolactone decarboxylase family protein [Spongiibacteraceae bacterium]
MSKPYDREKGIEMFNTVYCGDLPPLPEKGANKFTDFMLETLFGTLWADETLSIRDRRLLLLGAIAAQGEENTFTIQARSALKRGELTKEQLETVVVFLTQYVGYPKGSKMHMALGRIVADLGL